jgi:microcystin-dependent protein
MNNRIQYALTGALLLVGFGVTDSKLARANFESNSPSFENSAANSDGNNAESLLTEAWAKKVSAKLLEFEKRAELAERKAERSGVPIGSIQPVAGTSTPAGYLPCDGRTLDKSEYPRLFSVIGYSYTPGNEQGGGSFRIPDLSGRSLVGQGQSSSGSEFSLGRYLGKDRVALRAANLPGHTHGGTTGNENQSHYHSGMTREETQDHNHGFSMPTFAPDKGGNNNGHWYQVNHAQGHATGIQSNRHTHEFVTGANSTSHRHSFTTDQGLGLFGSSFEITPPVAVVNYAIRAF